MAFEPNRIGNTLIDIGIRMRLAALGVEALAREKDRSEDGQAICALLCQLSEEIAEVSALVTTDDCASLEGTQCFGLAPRQAWSREVSTLGRRQLCSTPA